MRLTKKTYQYMQSLDQFCISRRDYHYFSIVEGMAICIIPS